MTDLIKAEEKYAALLVSLRTAGGALVAFSGGVDSALLLHAAREALGDRVLAVTADSATYPRREGEEAATLASRIGARHEILRTEEMEDVEFKRNPPQRCYHCKLELFRKLTAVAEREGFALVAEGSNVDDGGDYRPGRRAVSELGIASPLAEAGLTKEEIRLLARARDLPVWNKPAAACLASRIPYGEPIREERLKRIERAEEAIRALGFDGVRVRDHNTVARVEVGPGDVERFLDAPLRRRAVRALKDAGYAFVTLDLEGYRTGSLNETLPGERETGD